MEEVFEGLETERCWKTKKVDFSGFFIFLCWGQTGFKLGFLGGFKLMESNERNVFCSSLVLFGMGTPEYSQVFHLGEDFVAFFQAS